MIPHRSTAKGQSIFFPKQLYRGRARPEQAIDKLKRFKLNAMRYEKLPKALPDLSPLLAEWFC